MYLSFNHNHVFAGNPITKQCVSSYAMADINRGENLEFKDLLQEIQRLQSPEMPDSVLLQGIQLPAGKGGGVQGME